MNVKEASPPTRDVPLDPYQVVGVPSDGLEDYNPLERLGLILLNMATCTPMVVDGAVKDEEKRLPYGVPVSVVRHLHDGEGFVVCLRASPLSPPLETYLNPKVSRHDIPRS